MHCLRRARPFQQRAEPPELIAAVLLQCDRGAVRWWQYAKQGVLYGIKKKLAAARQAAGLPPHVSSSWSKVCKMILDRHRYIRLYKRRCTLGGINTHCPFPRASAALLPKTVPVPVPVPVPVLGGSAAKHCLSACSHCCCCLKTLPVPGGRTVVCSRAGDGGRTRGAEGDPD